MAALQAQNEKAIDAIMADARAAYNEAAIALGETTLDDLAKGQLPPPKEAGLEAERL